MKNKSIYKLHCIVIKTAAMDTLIGELVLWTKMPNRTVIFLNVTTVYLVNKGTGNLFCFQNLELNWEKNVKVAKAH